MNKLLNGFLLFSLFILSGALLNLLKDGGARDEGPLNFVEYDGILNYLLPLWKFLCISFALVYYKSIKNKFNLIDAVLFLFILIGSFASSYPYESISQLLSLLLLYVFAKIYSEINGEGDYINVVLDFSFIITIGSYILIFIFPSYGLAVGIHEGKWQGVFEHKNSLGNTIGVLFLFQFDFCLKNKKILSFLILFLMAFLLVKAGSFTGIMAAFFGVISYVVFNFLNKKNYHVIFALFSSVAVIFMGANDISFGPDSKSFGFSGRNVIWQEVLIRSKDKIFLGHGFNQLFADFMSYSDEYLDSMGFLVSSSHNGFLNMFYSFGLFGCCLLMVFFYRKISLIRASKLSGLFIPLVVSLIVINTFEDRGIGFNFYCFIFLMISSFKNEKHE